MVREHTLNYLKYFKFIETCLMDQHRMLMYFMVMWKERVFYSWWKECFIHINQVVLVDTMVLIFYMFIDFLFSYSINCWDKRVEISMWLYLLFPPFHPFLLLFEFWCSVFRRTFFYDYHIFFMIWQLYHYSLRLW